MFFVKVVEEVEAVAVGPSFFFNAEVKTIFIANFFLKNSFFFERPTFSILSTYIYIYYNYSYLSFIYLVLLFALYRFFFFCFFGRILNTFLQFCQ